MLHAVRIVQRRKGEFCCFEYQDTRYTMGTLRKLQTEIDKTLKKVNEGLEEFDEIFDQVGCPVCSIWSVF